MKHTKEDVMNAFDILTCRIQETDALGWMCKQEVQSVLEDYFKRKEENYIKQKAFDIVETFEDLLDRKSIEIPCSDAYEESERHHDGNEAKLYGTEYWELVDQTEAMLRGE